MYFVCYVHSIHIGQLIGKQLKPEALINFLLSTNTIQHLFGSCRYRPVLSKYNRVDCVLKYPALVGRVWRCEASLTKLYISLYRKVN